MLGLPFPNGKCKNSFNRSHEQHSENYNIYSSNKYAHIKDTYYHRHNYRMWITLEQISTIYIFYLRYYNHNQMYEVKTDAPRSQQDPD